MSLWDDIIAKKGELDRLRTVNPKGIATLDDWYALELTYTSNAIEGNTLTRQETALVIDEGLTPAGKPLKDVEEAQDHDEAFSLAKDIAADDRPFNEGIILTLHRAVLKRSRPEDAGFYSQHQRRIRGSAVIFPSPIKIPHLMKELGDWLAGAQVTPETAIETHYRLVTIHPFSDGNGRTARLLMNTILMRAGYPVLVIAPEHRQNYLSVLENRQVSEDIAPYEEFMSQRLLASLDDYILAAKDQRHVKNETQ